MKPVLFSTEMVRAILSGTKTQTRRMMKPVINGDMEPFSNLVTAKIDKNYKGDCVNFYDENGWYAGAAQMRYQIGDILWVRETWRTAFSAYRGKYMYRADFGDDETYTQGGQQMPVKLACWRPSIHMPREAARIFLRVTDVRAERLQDISNKDAIAEGCKHFEIVYGLCAIPMSATDRFQALWNRINAKRGYGWDMNPWVWAIEFERCEKPV